MTPSPEEGHAGVLIGRLHAAVNARDAAAIGALCTDDVIWRDPAAPEPLQGRDAVIRFHREGMFRALPDASIVLIDGPYLSMDGLGVAVRTRIEGTMLGPLDPPGFAPTRQRVSFETAEFSRFRNGLLAQHTVVLNMLDLARQIGAMPRSGGWADRLGVKLQHAAAVRLRRRAAR